MSAILWILVVGLPVIPLSFLLKADNACGPGFQPAPPVHSPCSGLTSLPEPRFSWRTPPTLWLQVYRCKVCAAVVNGDVNWAIAGRSTRSGNVTKNSRCQITSHIWPNNMMLNGVGVSLANLLSREAQLSGFLVDGCCADDSSYRRFTTRLSIHAQGSHSSADTLSFFNGVDCRTCGSLCDACVSTRAVSRDWLFLVSLRFDSLFATPSRSMDLHNETV